MKKKVTLTLIIMVIIIMAVGCGSNDVEEEEAPAVIASDVEILTKNNHPKWLDDMGRVHEIWGSEIEAEKILLEDPIYQEDYILQIEEFSTDYSEDGEDYVGQLTFAFYNSDEKIVLEDGLNIISSYLPLDIIQENYNEEESYYMVDEEYDTIEYWKYYRIKDGKETPEKMDYSFYICIWTDMEGNMEEADINVVVANTDIIEDAEPWGYSFF